MKGQMERKRSTRIRLKESASGSQHSQKISEMDFGSPSNDILVEILSRVPDKPLARFKCVSKGWNNMICDPVFRKLQHQNSKAVISGFFFQVQNWYELSCQPKYVSINDEQVFVQHTILDFLPEDVYVIASNNGLLCCRNCWSYLHDPRIYPKVVYICNPAIKKYVKVEGPNGLWTNSVNVNQGLGFFSNPFSYSMDDSSNFTLVWISEKVKFKSYSFHIYSSEIGRWRMSDEVCYCQSLIYNDSRTIFASGVLYWLMTYEDEIVAFDVEKENSMCIGLPVSEGQRFNNRCQKCIGESEGHLQCVFISEDDIKFWSLNCELKWVNMLSISLASMEKVHPIFLYNNAKIMAYRKDVESWIEPLAFTDETLLLKLVCSFSIENNGNLSELSMKFYLYNLFNRTLEEICTVDELGLFSGIKTSRYHEKWGLIHGRLRSISHSMRA